MRSASLPVVSPGLSVCECGASGCYPPLCQPVLHHSESGPLGLSVRECGTGRGLLVVRLPASFVPHSSNLGPTTATRVLSAPVPVSAPPTGLYECFYFLGVGLPCRSIFRQFWLCEEVQCVYLPLHLGSQTHEC